jgi:hypothetical protein
MEAQVVDQTSNVTVLQSASALAQPLVRTKESIDPQISVAVKEIDPQSYQYSCEVTVANVADEDFAVLDVDPRLTNGITLKDTIDSAEIALNAEHRALCRSTGSLITHAALLSDSDLAKRTVEQLRDNFRQVLNLRKTFEFYYYYLFLRRYPAWVQAARDKSFKISIRNADDAQNAIRKFPLGEDSVDRRLVEYNIDQLKSIEKSDDFDSTRRREVLLKKGQQHKAIFVVSTKRGRLSPNTYSISFDIKLKREEYSVSRVAYATLTVPTGHLWTSMLAMAFALVGALVQTYGSGTPTTPAGAALSTALKKGDLGGIMAGLGVPVLTALVVYNVFDMTTLKDKVGPGRNWRTAVFVGFLCGFLNVKILEALSKLLG